MSLINEALRKARQAAAEHDDQRNAGRAPQAYPSRGRRRGAGPAAVALVAILAGLVGAAGVWWIVRVGENGPETRAAAVPGESPAVGSSVPTIVPTEGAGSEPGGLQPDEKAAPPVEPAGTPLPTIAAPAVSAPETDAPETGAPTARSKPVISASGERVFVMDAELGYASLSLGYIVFRRVRPFAEINGIDIYEGSEVDGFKVEKIEVDRVVLRDSRGPLVLRVP